MKQNNSSKNDLRVVNAEDYQLEPNRYELRRGDAEGAPACPYGNQYVWIGFDLRTNTYVRFTKSVFKRLVNT